MLTRDSGAGLLLPVAHGDMGGVMAPVARRRGIGAFLKRGRVANGLGRGVRGRLPLRWDFLPEGTRAPSQ